jgi:hypothetical protein
LLAVIAAISQRAAAKLAGLVSTEEDPEAALVRSQIAALKRLRDPETADLIKRKELRLQALLEQPSADPDLERKVADPRWFDLLSYSELTVVVHQLVQEIRVANGEPAAIALKL